MRAVKIAVVIPALDESSEIRGAIESASAPEVEVVVVDGGSRDATAAVATAAGARVIDALPGRARQLEEGARASTCEALLFLHADTRLPPGWADRVRAALADSEVAGGAFRLEFDQRTPGLRMLEWGVRLRIALFALPYGDQAIFVRRRVLDEIGGVPQAPLMEDLDLVRAIQRVGRLIVLTDPVTTSARRYLSGGILRTALAHSLAALAWSAGVDRDRIGRWLRR